MQRIARTSLTTIALTTVALAAITGRRAQSADSDLRPAIQEMRDEIRELRRDVKALRALLERQEDLAAGALPDLNDVHIESYLESNIALGAQASVSKMTGNEIIASIDGRPVFASAIFQRAFTEALTPEGTSLLVATQSLAAGQISEQDFRELQVFAIRKFAKDYIRTRALSQAMIASLGKTQKEKTEDAIAKEFNNYLERLKKDFNVTTAFEVDKRLRKQGTTLLSLKDEFRDRLLADEYLRGVATRVDKPPLKLLENREAVNAVEKQPPSGKRPSGGNTDLPDGNYFFYAQWSGPSRQMMRTVDRLHGEGHRIVKVDVDARRDLVERYEITTIPTFLIKKAGEETKLLGLQSEETLRAEPKLHTALQQLVSFDCDKLPLHEFLLRNVKRPDFVGPNIVIPPDVNLEVPITLHVSGVTLESALKLAFQQAHVKYEVKDGLLLLANEPPAERPVLITYPVADLLATPTPSLAPQKIDFQPLESLIQAATDTKSWKGSGGAGQIEHAENTLSLVIRQSSEVHKQIANLLQKLREPRQLRVTFRAAVLDHRVYELLEGSSIKLPSDTGTDFSCLTRAQSDFLLKTSDGTLVLERLPAASVAVGKEVTIPTRQGKKVWPQAVRLRTGQLAGRPYLWLDFLGDNPVLTTPLQTTVQMRLLPDLRPVLIEMKSPPSARVWQSPWGLTHTVDQLVGKPQERMYLLISPEIEVGEAPGEGSATRQ